MGIKTKLGMAMATSAAGVAMIAGGSFAIFTAQANTGWQSLKAGTVKITATTGTWTHDVSDPNLNTADESAWSITNLAPGDTQSQTVTIQNTGSLNEWVKIDTNVTGNLFQDNGVTGNRLTTNEADMNTPSKWISKDYAATGDASDFEYDNYPAYYWYSVSDQNGNPVDVGVAQATKESGSTTSSVFELDAGQSATITYSVRLPISAHNDYQGASGYLGVQVDAVQHPHTDGTKMNPDLNDMQLGNTPFDGNPQNLNAQKNDQYAGSSLN